MTLTSPDSFFKPGPKTVFPELSDCFSSRKTSPGRWTLPTMHIVAGLGNSEFLLFVTSAVLRINSFGTVSSKPHFIYSFSLSDNFTRFPSFYADELFQNCLKWTHISIKNVGWWTIHLQLSWSLFPTRRGAKVPRGCTERLGRCAEVWKVCRKSTEGSCRGVTALFTKPAASQFTAVPLVCLVQFLWNTKVSIGCQWEPLAGTTSWGHSVRRQAVRRLCE